MLHRVFRATDGCDFAIVNVTSKRDPGAHVQRTTLWPAGAAVKSATRCRPETVLESMLLIQRW